jgi:hypothetical protein
VFLVKQGIGPRRALARAGRVPYFPENRYKKGIVAVEKSIYFNIKCGCVGQPNNQLLGIKTNYYIYFSRARIVENCLIKKGTWRCLQNRLSLGR